MDINMNDLAMLAAGVVAASTAVTAAVPTTSTNRWVNFVLAVLNALAGNIGHNKNADAK